MEKQPSKIGLVCLIVPLLIGIALIYSSRGKTSAVLAANSVTIRAISPTGETFFTPSPQPIWRFAITNTSPSEVCWQAGIERSGAKDTNYSTAGGFIEWPTGTLASGQSIETNMIVPAMKGTSWRASVEFRPISHKESTEYRDKAEKFHEPVFDFCPHDKKMAVYNDEWHH